MTSIPSLRTPPIGFAHRGGRAHERENTLEAFSLALRLGATGLESDAWISADGHVVLDHDGVIGRWPRRRAVAEMSAAELPGHVPTLDALYERCGTEFDLSLDVKDPAAFTAIVDRARHAGRGAPARLWLCHPDLDLVISWRSAAGDVRLVNSTRMRHLGESPERRAARLADAGIDAINLHWSDWTPGHVTMFHRFGRYAFGWDAQHDRALDALLGAGIDAVFSDHVDRMMEAIERLHGGRGPTTGTAAG